MHAQPATRDVQGTIPGLAIPYRAAPAVRAAVERLGRTEDIRFSPDNRRLAIAGFAHNAVALVDVEITVDGGGPQVTVTDVAELSSRCLESPHGVDFLDDETIVVANRGRDVTVFRLPPNEGARHPGELTPIDPPPGLGFQLLNAPGSLWTGRDPSGAVEVLVCNNSSHAITRHVLRDERRPFAVTANDVLVGRWLDIPDGLAVSDDLRWAAVSNHNAHCVLLYDRSRSLNEGSAPHGVLRGCVYPHGLRFSADGRHLVVADAARPYIHVYARDGETWHGVRYPAVTQRVMDDDTYRRGRHNPQEGGPKGLDIDRRGQVIAVTSECQPIAFFDVSTLLRRSGGGPDQVLRLDYELAVLEKSSRRLALARDAEARSALADEQARAADDRAATAERRAEEAEERARAAEAQVAAFERTKTFRVTRPLRRAYGAWLQRRSRS